MEQLKQRQEQQVELVLVVLLDMARPLTVMSRTLELMMQQIKWMLLEKEMPRNVLDIIMQMEVLKKAKMILNLIRCMILKQVKAKWQK